MEDLEGFFKKVIERYSDMLFRVSFQYVRNRHDAEDVLQDVFLSLLKEVEKSSFNDDEHLKAWLIRVTIRKSINLAKYNARHRTAPIVERMALWEDASDMEELLNKLDPADREIIYLFYYEGYSAKEISSFVRKSEKSVYKRLSRARNQLKQFLS